MLEREGPKPLVYRRTDLHLSSGRDHRLRYHRSTAASLLLDNKIEWEDDMAESVYKVIELIGTSKESWEMAAKAAIDRAGKSLRDLRVAEVVQLDLQMDHGKIEAYRTKLKVSFKFEG